MFKKLQVSLIRKFARKRLGKDIAPLQTVATHPDVLIPYTKFSMALEKTNLFPAKLKVLGQIRAAKPPDLTVSTNLLSSLLRHIGLR